MEEAGRNRITVGVMSYADLYLCRPAVIFGTQAECGAQAQAASVELLHPEGLKQRGFVEVDAAVEVRGAEEDAEEGKAKELRAGGEVRAGGEGETGAANRGGSRH